MIEQTIITLYTIYMKERSSRHWRYRNLLWFIMSLPLAYALSTIPILETVLRQIGEWGYFGAFIIGILSVMTFTTIPALTILYEFSLFLTPLELAIFAGLGSVVGDFIIFSFFKHKVFAHFEPITERLTKSPVSHILHSRYFFWLTPVVGAIIIASPLPDELGIPLLSISKLKQWHFIILTFILNSVGIWALLTGTHFLFNR